VAVAAGSGALDGLVLGNKALTAEDLAQHGDGIVPIGRRLQSPANPNER
jgi:hypothetical protein